MQWGFKVHFLNKRKQSSWIKKLQERIFFENEKRAQLSLHTVKESSLPCSYLITACRARVDLAFVIDGSGSIEHYGKGNFRRCLNFVRAIVSRFNFRGGQTRVGVVLYSSRPRLIFDFRRYRSKGQILNAISRIRYPRGGTRTGYAMRYCYSRVFRYARRGVRKV